MTALRTLLVALLLLTSAHLLGTYTDSPEDRCARVGAEMARVHIQLDGSEVVVCEHYNAHRGMVEYPAMP